MAKGPMTAEQKEKHSERMREYWQRKKKGNGHISFDEFKAHVAGLVRRKDAPAAVLSVYKELLKLEKGYGEAFSLSADEICARNLEAERQLREGGYIKE